MGGVYAIGHHQLFLYLHIHPVHKLVSDLPEVLPHSVSEQLDGGATFPHQLVEFINVDEVGIGVGVKLPALLVGTNRESGASAVGFQAEVLYRFVMEGAQRRLHLVVVELSLVDLLLPALAVHHH